MGAILVVEQDPLVRELMREQVERAGHTVCAVSSVSVALAAAGCMAFALVLLSDAAAAAAGPEQLGALRGQSREVVRLRPAIESARGEAGAASVPPGWSPHEVEAIAHAIVSRLAPAPVPRAAPGPPQRWRSGTFPTAQADGDAPAYSVEALEALVLEATAGRTRQTG